MTEPLKILHVVNQLDGGGVELAIIRLARALSTRGVKQMVCTLREAGSEAAQLPSNVPLTTLNLGSFNPASSQRLSNTIRSFEPNIIHARGIGTWTDASLAALRNRHVKLLLGFHGREAKQNFTRLEWAKSRLWNKAAYRFTCVAESGKQQLAQELSLEPEKIVTLPNGTDTSKFVPCDEDSRSMARESLGIPNDCVVVGSVGSFSPVKDHKTLLTAFADAITHEPNLFLVLVGEGPSENIIRKQMDLLGITHRVLLTGWREDIDRVLPAFDLFVNSSRSESMCNAILEAMACGLPIVATTVGDTSVLLNEGCAGILVPPESSEAMVDSILETIRNPEMREKMSRAAREHVCENYGIDQFEKNYLELYLGVANPSDQPHCLYPQGYYRP